MINKVKEILNEKYTVRFFIFSFFCIFLSIIFNYLSFKNVLLGVYKWHIKQPESLQGGIELLVVFVMMCLSATLIKRKSIRYILIFLIPLLYLKLHLVFEPVIVVIIYFEIIISIGMYIKKLANFKKKNDLMSYINTFFIGLIVWSVFAILLSFLGYGRFNDLRILTVVLGLISLTKGINIPLTYVLFKKFNESSKGEKILQLSIFMIVLMQLAKSNRSIDYDSIWYGLRPEFVLIGQHSFFDNLGLVGFVHYYPKLWELFLVPISNLGDYSFIYSATTLIFLLLIIVIYSFIRFFNYNKRESLYLTLLVATIPFFNMASTAKADIFTSFIIMLVCYYLYVGYISNKSEYIYIGISAAILSFGTRGTSFLYTPLILFGFLLVYSFKYYINNSNKLAKANRKIEDICFKILLLLASLFVLFGISYRTFKLTGYPVYPLLTNLWNVIGFKAKYPLGVYSSNVNYDISKQLLEILKLAYHLNFKPSNINIFSQYVMVWPGNIALYIAIIIMLIVKYTKINLKQYVKSTVPFIFCIIAGVYFSLNSNNGRDGNYYIIPTVLLILVLLNVMFKQKLKIKKVMYACFMCFILLQLSIMFVSHPSWRWGTDKINLNLCKDYIETPNSNSLEFEYSGLSQIARYIDNGNDDKLHRCIGFGNAQTLNKLKCRYEDIFGIIGGAGNPSLFSDKQTFIKYVKWAKIDYILIPKDENGISGYKYITDFCNEIQNNKNVKRIDSDKYYLINISNILNEI